MKSFILLVSILSICSATFCQSKPSTNEKLKTQIIELEKAGWKAWNDKNISWFQNNTTEECIWVNSDGIMNKTEMIKSTSSGCTVKSYSLDSFQFTKLNNNTILLTYIVFQDGYCGDNKLPSKIRASVNYVNRNGKWLEAFYMETPVSH